MEAQAKVAIVIGGAQGIGKATCWKFAEEGIQVVIADVETKKGVDLAKSINDNGYTADFVRTDVSDEGNVKSLMSYTASKFGRLDILVNCAAAFNICGLEATVDDWRTMLEVNVIGCALAVKHAAPIMRKNQAGAIVNVSSISGFIAQPGYLTYNASKAAVANMTRCMALDLAADGIRVNAVCPGTVWTENNAQVIKKKMGLDRTAADQHPEIGGTHMLKRTADPEEIASAIFFLSSDEASFITAENLFVDGGYIAM